MGGFQEKFPKIEEKQRRRKRVIREWRWRDAGVFGIKTGWMSAGVGGRTILD